MSLIATCVSLVCLVGGVLAQETPERGLPHASPCPAVYSYGWEPAGGWHGVITIMPPARFSEVQLVLRMTVPYYRPEAGVGRVEVKGGTPEIQAISRRAFRGERHKIQFMIVFPPFDDVPRVKEIFFNGKSFCAANQVYGDTRSTIELKYTLRTGLNLPLANGNAFSVVSTAPSRPDLVTVAILRPTTDEARPTVSSPRSPPCKCNKTRDESEDVPMQHRPDNHVFHAFKAPPPSVMGAGPEDPQDDDNAVGTDNQAANANRPPNGNKPGRPTVGGSNYAPPTSTSPNRPPNGNKPGRPTVGGSNYAPPTPTSPNRPPNGNKPGRPTVSNNGYVPPTPASPNRPPNGNKPGRPTVGSNGYAPPTPASPNRPPSGNKPGRPTSVGGSNGYAPPPHPPSNKNDPVDDKIYFIMTDSEELDSPRIVKLLEHLLAISKKRYQVDLERLEIEKKRLALEKYPHYTFVV